MAGNFKELRAKMSPERQTELPLTELRAARGLTLEQLAESFGVTPAYISELERLAEMDVSMLGKFIEAMGGRLEIRAVFPDDTVSITGFQTQLKGQEESLPIEEVEMIEELDRRLSQEKASSFSWE